MIINEVTDLVKNCKDDPAAFDQFVDEFRGQREAAELLQLLNCNDDELVRIGTWILSEISASKYDNELFRNRLRTLTCHSIPAIRLHSLNALFPLLSTGHPETSKIIERLRADPNEGVRLMADAASNQLGLTP